MDENSNKLINGFLKNIRLITSLIIDVMKKTIKDYPQILEEDEQKCQLSERNERNSWITSQLKGSTDKNLIEYYKEESKNIKRVRFTEAIYLMEKYYRLSHILDEDGYTWDKFFNKEEDEPESETLMRQLMDNNNSRSEWRVKIIRNFIKYTYEYWTMIKEENIDFFTNYLQKALPNSEFTDKLEIIYGKNNNKQYISKENIKQVWRMIHGSIKVAIKYMYYSNNSTFTFTKNVDGEKVFSHTLNIDIQSEITKWAVNLEIK